MASSATVFISHVAEDEGIVRELAGHLERAGISTWFYERDAIPGPPHLAQTLSAIQRAQAFLVVISQSTLDSSHQVETELMCAYENSKHLVPLRYRLTHDEFKEHLPTWNFALGPSVSIDIHELGVYVAVQKISEALQHWGVKLATPALGGATAATSSLPDGFVVRTAGAREFAATDLGSAQAQSTRQPAPDASADEFPAVDGQHRDPAPNARPIGIREAHSSSPRSCALRVQRSGQTGGGSGMVCPGVAPPSWCEPQVDYANEVP